MLLEHLGGSLFRGSVASEMVCLRFAFHEFCCLCGGEGKGVCMPDAVLTLGVHGRVHVQDWQELCEAYDVTECMLGHRPGYEKDPLVDKMMKDADKSK